MLCETKTALRRFAVAGLAASALLTGCASQQSDSPGTPVGPATAASAPVPARAPIGETRKLSGHPQVAYLDPDSAALVILGGDDPQRADTVSVLAPDEPVARTVELPEPATGLISDGPGRALASSRGGYLSIDLRTGTVGHITVDDADGIDFTAIVRRADGTLVLGSAEGSVFVLSSPTGVAHREKLVTRVDSLVAQQNTVVVLDRAQTSVTAIGADGKKQQALRAGEGATTMAVDGAGRVLVADTRGEELLVFSVDPLMMRQRYPVREAPYGLAASPRLTWVSQTAANTVIGYDLATGIPVEKVRYPTVQQPNLVSYDAASGVLYVVSGSGAGVQAIAHAEPPQ